MYVKWYLDEILSSIKNQFELEYFNLTLLKMAVKFLWRTCNNYPKRCKQLLYETSNLAI